MQHGLDREQNIILKNYALINLTIKRKLTGRVVSVLIQARHIISQQRDKPRGYQ